MDMGTSKGKGEEASKEQNSKLVSLRSSHCAHGARPPIAGHASPHSTGNLEEPTKEEDSAAMYDLKKALKKAGLLPIGEDDEPGWEEPPQLTRRVSSDEPVANEQETAMGLLSLRFGADLHQKIPAAPEVNTSSDEAPESIRAHEFVKQPREESGLLASQYDLAWNHRFRELKRFRAENGHCNVPQGYKKNKVLGTWVNNQRRFYRQSLAGKNASMTKARIQKLNSIGFEWDRQAKRSSQKKQLTRETEPEGETEPTPEELARRKKNALSLLHKIKIGTRLGIFWPMDNEYYPATVKAQGAGNPCSVSLLYDDQDTEWIDLTEHDFKLLPVPARRTKKGRLLVVPGLQSHPDVIRSC
jgi:hypothetical protein